MKVVLSRVIAHELGHLLMPGEPHSATGVMRSSVNDRDLRLAASDRLLFTAEQAAQIRSRLEGRRPSCRTP
jgi:hypothetical protein